MMASYSRGGRALVDGVAGFDRFGVNESVPNRVLLLQTADKQVNLGLGLHTKFCVSGELNLAFAKNVKRWTAWAFGTQFVG